MTKTKLLSLGTMYVDINCVNFPFVKGLFVNRETTGGNYLLEMGGSALNFARLTTALGIETTFIGKIGNDTMGDVLTDLLKQNSIIPAITKDKNAQTNIAVHYVHTNGSSIMTSSGNANQSLSYTDIVTHLDEQLGLSQYLYLGGCFKLKKVLPYLPQIAKAAKDKGVITILDHGRVNNSVTSEDIKNIHELLPYIDIYLPSIDEFLAVWKVQTLEEGIIKLNKHSRALVVIKQGDLGAVAFNNGKKIEIQAVSVTVINTVGAGDSFNAGFIKAHKQGLSLEECISYACATAAVKISSKSDPTPEAVEKIYQRKKVTKI